MQLMSAAAGDDFLLAHFVMHFFIQLFYLLPNTFNARMEPYDLLAEVNQITIILET